MFAIPPRKTTKSVYMEFKELLIQKFNAEGKAVTAKEAQRAFKASYEYMDMKRTAESNYRTHLAQYEEGLRKWSFEFNQAIVTHLEYVVPAATAADHEDLRRAIAVADQVITWSHRVPKTYPAAVNDARMELSRLRNEKMLQDLVKKLTNAAPEIVLEHCQQHVEALQEIQRLKKFEANKKAEELIALQDARKIKATIIRHFKSQNLYSNCNRKVKYTMTLSGTDPQAIFSAAFDGTTSSSYTIYDAVNAKVLRYGERLTCGPIYVSLNKNVLTAETKYYLEGKQSRKYPSFSFW